MTFFGAFVLRFALTPFVASCFPPMASDAPPRPRTMAAPTPPMASGSRRVPLDKWTLRVSVWLRDLRLPVGLPGGVSVW